MMAHCAYEDQRCQFVCKLRFNSGTERVNVSFDMRKYMLLLVSAAHFPSAAT